MISIIPTIHIIISVLLIALILMQQSEAGIGAVFGGGESDTYAHTRRGAERFIFITTFVLGGLFIVFATLSFLVA